ncbi:YHS domain-containing (seleno)protein [uncultured Sneathiella sp.]|uniref:YHS domain-containing (seleno)protein n=1 Tax=uncultured Sneathiella sp. TaxID=879315 RepID=UPI0025925CA6|nr:YHS domain-containing (seleno)protein [uncultured Sneathiella sp.]
MRGFIAAITLLLALTGAGTAVAFEEVNKSFLGGLAVDGHDSTAYFTKSGPAEGEDEYSVDYKGATWRFVDAKSRDLFAADPESYAPQYGGYCSNQMSLGNLSDVDPGVWLIFEGKLYLFGHDAGRIRWQNTGIAERIRDADQNWQKYLASK